MTGHQESVIKTIHSLFLLVVLVLAVSGEAVAGEKIGVVLMHGKGGTAAKGPIGSLAGSLRKSGFLVKTPDMPWSKLRIYAKSYDDSMAEIDQVVAALKADGAGRIVVAGQSIGANAALGYAARRDGLAGVIAIGPGHVVELGGYQGKLGGSVGKARDMVAAGKGSKTAPFKDNNQGKTFTVKTSADIYLSWFDPGGPAVMPVNVENIKAGTPLLWIVGNKDVMFKRGEAYAFANAPPHPQNAYVVVPGGHGATPNKSVKQIIKWLKSL